MTAANGADSQPDLSASPALFSWQLRSEPDQLRPARHAITRWATHTGLRPDQVQDLTLAVNEALSNTIEHAYPTQPGPIWVDGHLAFGQVRVIVSDHGQWRTPNPHPSWRGRGLSMIGIIADHAHLDHSDGATTVTMVWNLPS